MSKLFKAPIEKLSGVFWKGRSRLFTTLMLIFVVLHATWMGGWEEGGYLVDDWAPTVFVLAAVALLVSIVGTLGGTKLRWSVLALGLFAAYTAWTFASLLWSPNKGDAWLGAGQTLLYLLVFWVTVALVTLGSSRRWVLAASVLGPSVVAALTLLAPMTYFGGWSGGKERLQGTVTYHNGEAAFLLIPFWVAVYLGGSRRVNPLVRGAALAGAVLCVAVAVLTQSRGAMVAMALSLPVFFALSGQRLRGFLALAPIAAALFVTFPGLNGVYQAFLEEGDPGAALDRVVPTVWLCAAGAGLYGLSWGLIDRWWRPPVPVARAAGAVVLAGCLLALVLGALTFTERFGDPVAWGQQKWEAFKTDDVAGQEESRYLMASGSGRYTLWQVAWEDFERHPLLGIGTHNYEATYYQLRKQDVGFVRQPHSLPLEVLAERGVIGGALFFGFLATCLVVALRERFRNLRSEGKAQVGALIAAVTYWFAHSSAEWFWQMSAVTLPAIVYLAMLVSPWRRSETAPRFRTWPLRALGAGVAVLAIAAVAPLFISDRYLVRSHGVAIANPKAALGTVERAQRFNPLDYLLFRGEAQLATRIGDRDRAERAYRHAVRLNPEHYYPYLPLARFYARSGESERALSYYRKAQERNPLDENIEQRMTRLKAIQQQMKQLETRLGGGPDARDAEDGG